MSWIDHDILTDRRSVAKPKVARGVVTIAPTSVNDSVHVTVAGRGTDAAYEVVKAHWVPRGGGLPPVGAQCLLIFDHLGDAWVSVWEGTSFPPINVGDTAGGDLSGTYPNPSVSTWGGQSKAAVVAGNPPQGHHATHEPAGSDPMAVDAVAGTGSLRTLGTGAQQAVSGTDSRLSNARTPTAHATTHQPGGSDAMAVDAVAATGSLRTLGNGIQQARSGSCVCVRYLANSVTTSTTGWQTVGMTGTYIDPLSQASGTGITVTNAGLYRVTGQLDFTNQTGSSIEVAGGFNGAQLFFRSTTIVANSQEYSNTFTAYANLTAGTAVTLSAYVSSAISLGVVLAGNGSPVQCCWLAVERVG